MLKPQSSKRNVIGTKAGLSTTATKSNVKANPQACKILPGAHKPRAKAEMTSEEILRAAALSAEHDDFRRDQVSFRNQIFFT